MATRGDGDNVGDRRSRGCDACRTEGAASSDGQSGTGERNGGVEAVFRRQGERSVDRTASAHSDRTGSGLQSERWRRSDGVGRCCNRAVCVTGSHRDRIERLTRCNHDASTVGCRGCARSASVRGVVNSCTSRCVRDRYRLGRVIRSSRHTERRRCRLWQGDFVDTDGQRAYG